MSLKWEEGPPVRNPVAHFRVNTVSRTIADDLQVDPDAIWWLVLIRLDEKNKVTIEQLRDRADELAKENEWERILAIPGEYDDNQRSSPEFGIVSVYARRFYINEINRPDGVKLGVDSFEVGAALEETQIAFSDDPFELQSEEVVKVSGKAVVVAVIDNGMAIGHELFRGPMQDGAPTTRVEYFWNMDGSPQGSELEPSSIGNSWTRPEINALLKENFFNGLLDDQSFYTALGATDWTKNRHVPIAHRLSHGTHVMGLCAGYASDDPIGADRPIIAVNLRTIDVQDPSGTRFATWLEQALTYIIERYKRFRIEGCGKRPPLVINFSFGNYAGPHDGSGLIEEKISEALDRLGNETDAPYQFILPDGNGNEARVHAALTLAPGGGGQTLPWRVQPGDRSVSALEFWFDTPGGVAPDYVTLTVTGPGGIVSPPIDCTDPAPIVELKDNGVTVGQASFTPAPDAQRRGSFRVQLYATHSPSDVGPFAPSGLWECHLAAGPGPAEVRLKAWVLRDQDLPGFPEFGRQSYLDMASYCRQYHVGVDANPLDRRLVGGPLGYDPLSPTSPVKRNGTLSGFATGSQPVVIGGFVGSDRRMALYSATGPTNTFQRRGPDASARSDDSHVLSGVISAGSASGSMVAMPGTSVSAPQVCRWVAGEMSDGSDAGRVEVCHAALQMDPASSTKPPPRRTGCGRMLCLPVLFGKQRWVRQVP